MWFFVTVCPPSAKRFFLNDTNKYSRGSSPATHSTSTEEARQPHFQLPRRPGRPRPAPREPCLRTGRKPARCPAHSARRAGSPAPRAPARPRSPGLSPRPRDGARDTAVQPPPRPPPGPRRRAGAAGPTHRGCGCAARRAGSVPPAPSPCTAAPAGGRGGSSAPTRALAAASGWAALPPLTSSRGCGRGGSRALPRQGAAAPAGLAVPGGAARPWARGGTVRPQGRRRAALPCRRQPPRRRIAAYSELERAKDTRGSSRPALGPTHSTIPASHVCAWGRNSSGALSGSVGTREGTRVLSVREAEPLPSKRVLLFAPAACSTVGVGSEGFSCLPQVSVCGSPPRWKLEGLGPASVRDRSGLVQPWQTSSASLLRSGCTVVSVLAGPK